MHQSNKFLEQVPDVLMHFPLLKLNALGGKTFIAGRIELFAEGEEIVDSYEIEIHPTSTYPESFPQLYEFGGRIPRNIDWHVYPTGICCLAVPIEETITCRQGITLTEFVKKYVCGFLFSQTFRRSNGYFYRERSHGLTGTLEYYKEILDLRTLISVYNGLRIATSKVEMKNNAKCFCGSNKKFQKCHRGRLRMLIKLAGGALDDSIKELEEAILSRRNQS